jgi:PIN domain nuclease of toxin-antitoxin system
MKLLLDTHVLLWAAGQPERLSQDARALIEDRRNALLFSSANLWEIVIRHALGREDFRVDARRLRRAPLANGYDELAMTGEHVIAVGTLPMLHKDPFDRLLIAQAIAERVTLLTADPMVARYPAPVRQV